MKFLIYIKNIIAWALFLLMRMMFPLIYKDGAGILFVSTHGGENAEVGGFIAVEAYPTGDDGRLAALEARDAYIFTRIKNNLDFFKY